MNLLVSISVSFIAIALVLSMYRLVRGPHIADRIASFDLLTATVIAICAALSVTLDIAVLFDVAILVCLVSFVGTVAFAFLLDRNEENA